MMILWWISWLKGLMCMLGLNGILSNQVLQSQGESCALFVFYVLYKKLHVGFNS